MLRRTLAPLAAALLVAAGCSDSPTNVQTPSTTAPAAPQFSATPGTVSGPAFPAPGGTTATGTGTAGRLGGRTFTYNGINLGLFSVLAWGPSVPVEVAMNGVRSTLTFHPVASNLPVGLAIWMGTTQVATTAGIETIPVRFILRMTGADNATRPLISASSAQAAALGLPAGIGAAFLVTENGWRANLLFEAQHPSVNSGVWIPFLDVYDALRTSPVAPPGQAITSFGGGFYWTDAQCPAGQYFVAPAGCTPAPAGSYVPTSGAREAINCPAGTFQAATGAISCDPAPAGHYVAVAGATSASPCAVGYFQPAVGQTSCIAAPVGHFVSAPGSAAATACAPGFYQPAIGADSCFAAPAGSFVAGVGSDSATPCAAGYFQPATGATSCIPAPVGSYVPGAGATSALPCPVGTTSHVVASTACVTVSPTALTLELTQVIAALRAAGTISAGEATSLTAQLNAALQQYGRGNKKAAENQLGAFINHVQALMRSGRMTAAQGAALIAAAEAIITAGRN